MELLKENAAPISEMGATNGVLVELESIKDSENLSEIQASDFGVTQAVMMNLKPQRAPITERKFFEAIISRAELKPLPNQKAATLLPFVLDNLKRLTEHLICVNDMFMWYDNSCWRLVDKKKVGLFLREFAHRLGVPDDVIRPSWGIEALIKQASYDICEEIESNTNVFNFPNGTYEVDTDIFREHRASDYIMYVLPYDYDPFEKCYRWDKHLERVLPIASVRTLLQECIGYLIAGVRLEKIPYLYGDGCNGKSITLNSISAAFGAENVSNVSLEDLTNPDGKGLAMAVGKLANIANENSPKMGNEATFKAYVSKEKLKVKRLYKDEFITDNYALSVVAANSLPVTNDFSGGYYRRMLYLPFNEVIRADEMDVDLESKLLQELPGIFNWILDGVRRIRQNRKFSECKESQDVLKAFRLESDSIAQFIDESSYIPSNNTYEKKLLKDIVAELTTFCSENGFFKANSVTLSRRLRKLGFKVDKATDNKTFVWLKLREFEPEISDLPF